MSRAPLGRESEHTIAVKEQLLMIFTAETNTIEKNHYYRIFDAGSEINVHE